MAARRRRWTAVLLGAPVLLCLAGCLPGEDVSMSNASDGTVTVRLGDVEIGEITPDGGLVLLDVTACDDGPVVVTYADGRAVTLEGPLCPGDRLVVREGTVDLVAAADAS